MNSKVHEPSLRKALANSLMSLCVPNNVVDDIKGDLQEEFAEIINTMEPNIAKNWYLRQGIKTAAHYLWYQRGDQMILLFAFSIFSLAIFFILALSAALDVFYDAATLVTVVLPSVLLGVATTNISALKTALVISLLAERPLKQDAYSSAIQFLRNSGNLALMMGALVFSIQWLGYFSLETTKPEHQLLTSTITTSMLSPIYGLLFKILCFTGEKKVGFKCKSQI